MAFYKIANLIDIEEGCRVPFKIAGKSLLLIQDSGQPYVIENRCPHMDAPLATGKVENGNIVCRAHGIAFCLQSGKPQGPLADTLACLTKYEVVYDGNTIGIEL